MKYIMHDCTPGYKGFRNFFMKDTISAKKRELLEELEFFLSNIRGVQEGAFSTEVALNNIERVFGDRKLGVTYRNILNTCELLFWLTATVTSLSVCIAIGIPVIFFNPLTGLAIIIGTTVSTLESAKNTQECIDKYQSYNEIDEQDKREKNLLSLFPPRIAADKYEHSIIILRSPR